jgi:hypothetical protein
MVEAKRCLTRQKKDQGMNNRSNRNTTMPTGMIKIETTITI